MTTPDYSGFEEKPSEDMFSRLNELAKLKHSLELKVGALTAQLATVQEELRSVSEFQIPELMEQMKLKAFTTMDGFKVTIKEEVRANWPTADLPEKRENAVAWLNEVGEGNLVKNTIVVQFDKGDEKLASMLKEFLQQLPKVPTNKEDATVHYQTLGKLIRDRLKDGKPVPMELFGSKEGKPAYVQKVAKIG